MSKEKLTYHYYRSPYTTLIGVLGFTLITACGGGGGKSSNHNTQGTLVTPDQAKVSAAKILAKKEILQYKDSCPEVPAGYSPLRNINVDFLDNSNKVVSTTTTNECGFFSASTTSNVTQIKANSSGNKPIISEVQNFQQSGTKIASCIPASAQYQIASIQFTTNDKLGFTVTDSLTNKAVIGIPASALSVKINSNSEPISSLQSAAAANDPASVVLVMDASGSMKSRVRDSNGSILEDQNGNAYTRYRISALAAHTYLDNVDTIDETAMVLFSSQVHFINDTSIENLFRISDSQGKPSQYHFSSDGFSTNPASLRFIVDAYNRYSTIYSQYGVDNKHTDTPDLHISYYPLGGTTAFYDAIEAGIDQLTQRSNTRKIIIAMSDGRDNSSSSSENIIITHAKSQGIPVYTIAYALGNDETMKQIANQTNASYFIVNDLNLIGAFQSIQTGIIFQYLAGLTNSVHDNDIVELTLDFNGTRVSRSLVRL